MVAPFVSPQSQSDLENKNLLWKSLRPVQIIFRELCQGVTKWAIISLHQRVRFHQVHALVNALLPLKQGSLLSLSWAVVFARTSCQLHCSSDNLMNQFSSLSWQKMLLLFSLFFVACEMKQLRQEWQSIQNVQSGTRTVLGLECIVMGKKGKKGSVYNNILTWVSCSLPLTIAVIVIS